MFVYNSALYEQYIHKSTSHQMKMVCSAHPTCYLLVVLSLLCHPERSKEHALSLTKGSGLSNRDSSAAPQNYSSSGFMQNPFMW